MEMRKVYCEALIEAAEKDERIVLINSDSMKVTATAPFKEKFPERSLNVGIAEANMVGVAAGLAAYGKIPVVNSFTSFATRRCFDQIVISVAYAGLNVKIVGNNPGILSELNGGTHMSMEDIGIMRTIPNMTIIEPIDEWQLRKAVPVIMEHDGPVYLRLNRGINDPVYSENYKFNLGKGDILKEGKDVAVIASGFMVLKALRAAEILKSDGIDAAVVNIHTIKPIDSELLIDLANKTGTVVTVENHSIIGGLGSAVAEVLIENAPVRMKRIGVNDCFGEVGNKNYLLERFDLTPEKIAAQIKSIIMNKKNNL